MNSSKSKSSPLLAELFGSILLMAYNFRQTIKAGALNTLILVTTANYCAKKHICRQSTHGWGLFHYDFTERKGEWFKRARGQLKIPRAGAHGVCPGFHF